MCTHVVLINQEEVIYPELSFCYPLSVGLLLLIKFKEGERMMHFEHYAGCFQFRNPGAFPKGEEPPNACCVCRTIFPVIWHLALL